MSGPLLKAGNAQITAHFNGASQPKEKKKSAAGHRVTLRLSSAEYETLQSCAIGQSLSSYIRACVFGRDSTPRKRRARAVLKSETALAKILGLLGQSEIVANLGELAQYAREGSFLMDDVTYRQIEEANAAVLSMRGHLIKQARAGRQYATSSNGGLCFLERQGLNLISGLGKPRKDRVAASFIVRRMLG